MELFLKIITQDSIEETLSSGYFTEADVLLRQMDSRLFSTYAIALPNVTFVLYADQLRHWRN